MLGHSWQKVLYTAGTVFDNLRSSELSTRSFLQSGDDSGIVSRADLDLLNDLRDAAEIAVHHKSVQSPVSEAIVNEMHRAMTRSAALRPGKLRTKEQNIGVSTSYGRHMPPALEPGEIDGLLRSALTQGDRRRQAAWMFVLLAKAQPFEDGNKRTALLTANIHLPLFEYLCAPYDPDDIEVSRKFQDLLARAYVFDEIDPVVDYLLEYGLIIGE